MLKKVFTDQLETGMYVAELDRPWTETNFLFQGLLMERSEDIRQMQDQCIYVYVESEDEPPRAHAPREFGIKTLAPRKGIPREGIDEILRSIPRDHTYPNTVGVEDELENALKVYNVAAAVYHSLWNRVRVGKRFRTTEVKPVVQRIACSVLRNPDAFLLLRTVCDDMDYHCRHAINSSALAVAFARHLGLAHEELSQIAIGVFLLDIGKARVPEQLLDKRGPLTNEELLLLRTHTTLGVQVLTASDDFHGSVIDIVQSHHERDNGKGYPDSLDGNQIPVYARMAALVDSFDAITIDRPYKKALTTQTAVQIIYEASNIDFQKPFVEEFIRCLGEYPTGSAVELSSGHIATVVGQNPDKPEQPRVMLLRTEKGTPLNRRIIIDLGEDSSGSQHVPIEIAKMLANDLPTTRIVKRLLGVAE